MASAKDIKKKIRSISNTKKITRTMEMVSTVKSKRGQDRIQAVTPYSDKLVEILRSLARSGSVTHPFLAGSPSPAESREHGDGPGEAGPPVLVMVITGNRGLCGGYNTNVLHMAEEVLRSERDEGHPAEVYMVGKKGISRFRFRGVAMAKTITTLGDEPCFEDVEEIAAEIIERYLAGELERVVVVATRYHSSSTQTPAAMQLLPMERPAEETTEAPAGAIEYIFEPGRDAVLDALLPYAVKTTLHRILVEARASEHIARRIAMKMATDNAEQMIRSYTTKYNRQRQAGITQQIVEVVSGADALG